MFNQKKYLHSYYIKNRNKYIIYNKNRRLKKFIMKNEEHKRVIEQLQKAFIGVDTYEEGNIL